MHANKVPTKSDLRKLDSLTDSDIDYSDIPELTDDFWETARWVDPAKKQSLTIRYDADIVDYFKAQVGKGYQSKMNAVLKAYVEHSKARYSKKRK